EGWAYRLVLALLALPLLAVTAVLLLIGHGQPVNLLEQPRAAVTSLAGIPCLMLLFPSAVVLGYTHARALVQRYRWRLSQVASRHDMRSRGLLTLLPVTCLLGSATLLHSLGFSTPRLGTSDLATLFLLFGELLGFRSEEHTSELQSRVDLVCRLLLE